MCKFSTDKLVPPNNFTDLMKKIKGGQLITTTEILVVSNLCEFSKQIYLVRQPRVNSDNNFFEWSHNTHTKYFQITLLNVC